MNNDVRIMFRWTPDELINGQRWHLRHSVRPVFRVARWLLSAALIAVGTSSLWTSHSPSQSAFLLFAGLYFPALVWIIRPWLFRRQFAKRPDRDIDIEWHISDDLIHVHSKLGTSDFAWAALAKVVETPAGFLFYPTHQIFHWLPKHAFANNTDFEHLSQLAQQKASEFHKIS